MASRWDRRRGTRKASHVIIAVAAGLSAVLIIGFFFYKATAGKTESVDRVTFCPQKVESVTAILIDATDELSVVQRTAIRNRIDQVKDGLPRRGRIDLYAIGEEQQGMVRALFSTCNPGTGADADAFNENARQMKKKWTKEFSERLDLEIDRVMKVKAATQSPIMEAIQAIALQSFGKKEVDLSPKFHPAPGRVPMVFEPIWSGDATGRGAEPQGCSSASPRCLTEALSLA